MIPSGRAAAGRLVRCVASPLRSWKRQLRLPPHHQPQHHQRHYYRSNYANHPDSALLPLRRLCGEASSGPAGRCWKCSQQHQLRGALFCGDCGAVQPPDPGVSHFELLLGGEPASPYRLDAGRLGSAMRQLQWRLHPDKFVQASEQERNLAQQQSARVNAAYRCLSEPVHRAVYLLGLRGVAMPTEETGSGRGASGDQADGDLPLPQEFLAQMLELNEALMEADPTAVAELSKRVDADTEALTEDLARAFESSNLELAKELTYRLKYFANVRAKIREMT